MTKIYLNYFTVVTVGEIVQIRDLKVKIHENVSVCKYQMRFFQKKVSFVTKSWFLL